MLKLDYKAFITKTGSRLKPLKNKTTTTKKNKNPAINDALALQNNI